MSTLITTSLQPSPRLSRIVPGQLPPASPAESAVPDPAQPPRRLLGSARPAGTEITEPRRRERLNPLRLTDKIANPTLRKAANLVIAETLRSGTMLAIHAGVIAFAPPVGLFYSATIVAVCALVVMRYVIEPQIGEAWAQSLAHAMIIGLLFTLQLPGPLAFLSPGLNFNAKQAALVNIGLATAVAVVGTAFARLNASVRQFVLREMFGYAGLAVIAGAALTFALPGTRLANLASLGLPGRQSLALGSTIMLFGGMADDICTDSREMKLLQERVESQTVVDVHPLFIFATMTRIWRGN